MDRTILMSVLISFGVSVVLGPVVIPFLRRLKVGQTVRDEGPESHLKKNGTPTMGGILILISVMITACFFVKEYPGIVPVFFLMLGFGLIGFLDDYIKVVLKRSMGLRAWQKFLLQIVVTGVFVFYLLQYTDVSLVMKVPFIDNLYLVFRSDRDGQRHEFHGRPGWTGHFCYPACSDFFQCGGDWYGKRH